MQKYFSKNGVVLVTIIAAFLALFSSFQTWVVFTLKENVATVSELPVAGSEGFVFLTPVFVAVVAAAITLMISGPIPRILLGFLIAFFGGFIAWRISSLVFGAEPDYLVFGREPLTLVTGLAPSVGDPLFISAKITIFAYLTGVFALIILLLGIITVVFSRKWITGGKKYSTGSSANPAKPESATSSPDRISDWDSLSQGEDPSDF